VKQHRPITAADEQALKDLRQRLESDGLGVSDRCFFGIPGCAAYKPLPPAPPDEIRVLGRIVYLYASREGWAARVTPHGGPHWIRTAQSAAALEEFAREALATKATPPNASWRVSDDWRS
jgi:hypothetical protein